MVRLPQLSRLDVVCEIVSVTMGRYQSTFDNAIRRRRRRRLLKQGLILTAV